jgi:uncharacterized protein YcfJ
MRNASTGILIAATLSLGACASNGYDRGGYYDRQANRSEAQGALVGAAVGGAVGAAAGSVVGGVSTGEGAVAGAVVGGLVGAATANNNNDRRWYRDERGGCFYEDSRGERFYDYERRC